jgi:hypothetical protein
VIPEDKSLANVLYISEVNNCGYNSENPELIIIYCRGNLTSDNTMKILIM